MNCVPFSELKKTVKANFRLAATKLTRMIKKMVESHPDIISAKMVKFSSESIKTKSFRIVNIWATTQLPWAVKVALETEVVSC